jgi:hypothetical protein
MRRLVREYWKKINDTDTDVPWNEQIEQLLEDAGMLVRALDVDKKSKTPGYSMPLLSTLHDVLDRCDEFLKKSDRDLVRMVVREHFQEVMKMINDKSGAELDFDAKSTRSRGDKQLTEHFDELTAASPELRQEAFMELYFFKVLRQVRERAVMSYGRRQTTQYAPSVHSPEPSIDSEAEAKPSSPSPSASAAPSRPISPAVPPAHLRHESAHSAYSIPMLNVQYHGPQQDPEDETTKLESKASAIWCTLVLRMLCWLLLHDFNKKDVQIPKSELLGSRLPVYIA